MRYQSFLHLNSLVKRELEMEELFKSHNKNTSPSVVLPNGELNIDEVLKIISCGLSPENLTCDGELPRSEVAKKERFYENCLKELEVYTGNPDISKKLVY